MFLDQPEDTTLGHVAIDDGNNVRKTFVWDFEGYAMAGKF